MQCPICRGRQTGKVGADQYYCWSCYVEFSAGGESEVYEITEDGNLMALNTTGDDLS
ncbi:MAG TPA: hypothetical protein GX520_03520 [Syntrophaceticus sp.]|jgi:hypothetical protein|nr:hypothetical protein [Syntrophaceticus schinkii]HHY29744.1 hypothetical protein [Syntrophaceticus sp.]